MFLTLVSFSILFLFFFYSFSILFPILFLFDASISFFSIADCIGPPAGSGGDDDRYMVQWRRVLYQYDVIGGGWGGVSLDSLAGKDR